MFKFESEDIKLEFRNSIEQMHHIFNKDSR